MLRLSLLFALLPLAAGAADLMEYLKKYEGRWVGDFSIHSTATGYTEIFLVEQRFWLEDGVLRGISVSETDRGIETARSRTFVREGSFYSEVTRAERVETFIGALHDGGIVWLSSDLARSEDYQMKEFFVEIDGVPHLHTNGFDSYVFQGGLAHLVYRGRLRFAPAE